MSSSNMEPILLRPVFITATNMVLPIDTITINNLETIILNIFDSYLILVVIMGSIVVYNLYKLKKNYINL
jgi:hypothetical protein